MRHALCSFCRGHGKIVVIDIQLDAETSISKEIKTVETCIDCVGTGKDFSASDCEYKMHKPKQEYSQ
jgi:hypothetical protein